MSEAAPASEGRVQLAIEGAIARITFERPAQRNAMTWRMYEDLAAACETINKTSSLRAAILRGVGGKAFIAGTDIEQFRAFQSGADGIAYEAKIDTYVSALEHLGVPTVAVVEGWAVGGGLAIANACDLRIATAGTRFGVPIAKTLGNCLSPANLRRLTATLGLSMVKRMLLLAEMPTAEELMPLGYCAAIVPTDALDAKLEEIVQRLVSEAPITLRVTRDMLLRLAGDPNAEANDLIERCYASQDFHAGVEAFVTKAQAVWRNE